MLHGELYEKVFKALFPQYDDKVEEYYPMVGTVSEFV